MAKKAPNPVDRHVGGRVRMRRMMLDALRYRLTARPGGDDFGGSSRSSQPDLAPVGSPLRRSARAGRMTDKNLADRARTLA